MRSQEFIWKLTSIANHQVEDELHVQVNTSNMYLENNEGKHIHCWANTKPHHLTSEALMAKAFSRSLLASE